MQNHKRQGNNVCFLFKRVLDRGPEQSESKMTALSTDYYNFN